VAGKTGTAEGFHDAWFCGFVPQLTTCVWVGYPTGEIPLLGVEGVPEMAGGTIPAEIWHDFMTQAVASLPVEGFPSATNAGHNVFPRGTRAPSAPTPPAPAPATTPTTTSPPTTTHTTPPATTQAPPTTTQAAPPTTSPPPPTTTQAPTTQTQPPPRTTQASTTTTTNPP
jgi:penicillin-binding protein 1A